MASEDVAYDYIVIGAGSAGCVVAARLSEERGAHVLLLEAGGSDDHPDVHNPARWPALIGTDLDWKFNTIPQRHANDRVVYCPRAKMLGGCSSHNASVWVRGHRADFDHWAYLGNPGWDYASVAPIFKRIEDFAGGADEYRGSGGPMYMAQPTDPNPIAAALVEGAQEVGLPRPADYNGAQMEGVSYFDLCIKAGQRFNVRAAYLAPALGRRNLAVETNAHALRLTFEGDRCTGLQYAQHGEVRTARAGREVIVSAGAVSSPQLLLLSGIGPADELARLGIAARVDLPGVGKNLQDHVLLAGVNYETKGTPPTPKGNVAESTLWWKSDARLPAPDLQPVIIEAPFATPELAHLVPENAYCIAPGLVRPSSRGTVKLGCADPCAAPLIDMNYVATDADVRALLEAIDLCRAIGETRAFAAFRKREVMPGPLDRAGKVEFLRNSTSTFFHPTSSCKMGIDALAVVDPELRVHGVRGLRVADASVMPDITSGNTNAPTVMIAERAAGLIASGS